MGAVPRSVESGDNLAVFDPVEGSGIHRRLAVFGRHDDRGAMKLGTTDYQEQKKECSVITARESANFPPYSKLTVALVEKVWDMRRDPDEIQSIAREKRIFALGANDTLKRKVNNR